MLNRITDTITRSLAWWVVLAGIIGYWYPPALLVFKNHINWLFALTMVGIGAVMNADDFKPIIMHPRAILLGVVAQFAIMPFLGFVIARLFCLPPDLALGFIIAGAVPDAMAAGVISYLARTDVAFAIGTTTATTFLAPACTPALTYLYAHTFIPIPFWPMALSALQMVVIPLLIGIALKRLFRDALGKVAALFPAISTVFIALICGLVVALNRDSIVQVSGIVFAAVVVFNLCGMILGYGAGKVFRFDRKRSRTLALTVGMQNATFGAVLSLKHFSAQTALPNVIFAIWCIITASILAEIWARNG